jgi:predicted ATPase/DNA-binding SARP family transcriptional activator
VVRISLLGGVSAAADGGRPVDVGPAKCQTVLAILALSAGAAVPVPRLVDLVWGEDPPRTADKTLQSYIVRLRRALGAGAIVRTGAAYRLALGADAVDVWRFRRHLDLGEIDKALSEWAGPPLAGLDASRLAPMVDGLVEQWLGAVEIDLERRVHVDAQTAVGPLTELTANHPFREGLWALLMTALYRVGRQADALEAFQRARSHLVDQLGVEPGSQLRELESLILNQDQRLGPPGPSRALVSSRPTGTVTFGFCELAGSSRLWVAHRTKMVAAMARLDVLVRAAVDRHGGHVFVNGGESFGAAFHRADDACAWAVRLQLEASSEPWPGGADVRLRIGLHTGETEQGATSYSGSAVRTAAFIARVGHGGQTLVSGVTRALLERSDLRDLGMHHLGGGVAGQRVFQLGDGQHPPLRTEDSRRGNLPRRLDRLIGRDRDLALIGDALDGSPIVTLVGPGGIGKTSLALAVAARSAVDTASEARLIELASITSSSDVPRAVADTLEVTERGGHTLTQAIVAHLQSHPMLLVLDNCEHVVDGAAELVHAIFERRHGVRVLATSREALRVAGEQLIEVTPLDPAGPGVELFNERARAVYPAFDVEAHRADVEEICRRLDGVPLAIELAAARTRTLAPPDLVQRLDRRLHLLTGSRRTSTERHRTLRATIQWSYDLLAPPQQVFLHQLSMFAGPFDLAAAASVVTTDELGVDVGDLLGDVVDRSMLTVESGPFGRRFRLLETIREFATELLMGNGTRELEYSKGDDPLEPPQGVAASQGINRHALVAARHAHWCLDQVTRIHQLLVGPAEVEGVARLGELWPNLRAAFDWAYTTGDSGLASALVHPIAAELNLRKQSEIRDWAERILVITDPADEDQIAYWLTCAAYGCKQSGDHDRYERLLRRHGNLDHVLVRYTRAYLHDDGAALLDCSTEAVAWLRAHGEDFAAAHVEIAGVASALMSTGRLQELDAFVVGLADRYRAQGPPTLLYVTLTMLGYSALIQGKGDESDQLFDESAGIVVPARTTSVNGPVNARSAFKRGNRLEAFRILRSYVDELLDTDYTDLARLPAVEFITMMAASDRLPEAAPMLEYVAGSGNFGTVARRTLVADAVSEIADHAQDSPGMRPPFQPRIDDRQALRYMRDVLGELIEDPSRSSGPG